MIMVSEKPLDPGELIGRIDQAGAGSLVIHLGIVKPEPAGGGRSAGITFSRQGDLEGELAAIEAELRRSFPLTDVLLARRLGRLAIGDYILFVAAAAKDRDNAFAACRAALERAKGMKAIRKEEHYL